MKIEDSTNLIQIQEIRSRNNVLWMSLLEIALTSEPEKTKKVLKEITDNDKRVSELTSKLAE